MTLRYAHVADREIEAASERIGDVITEICNNPVELASELRDRR